MQFKYRVSPLNSFYEGAFDEKERQWRKVCAIDKAGHISDLLGDQVAEISTVLEVGCGTGHVIARIADLGIGNEFTAIDVADPTLNNRDSQRPNLRYVQQSGDTLPFNDKSFDLVVASHVLEHVDDERSFLRELKRVSRHFVYVEVPCELHLRTSFAALQTTLDYGHVNAYTPDLFALTLATAGLATDRMRIFDHSLLVASYHSTKLAARIRLAIRSSLLSLSESIATKVFTYHCGALCDVR